MQPYTREFARTKLTPQESALTVAKRKYRADIESGTVIDTGPAFRIDRLPAPVSQASPDGSVNRSGVPQVRPPSAEVM